MNQKQYIGGTYLPYHYPSTGKHGLALLLGIPVFIGHIPME
jgi:hypothetical protein